MRIKSLSSLIILLFSLGISACGSSGGPFEMATQTTMVVGDSGGGSPVQFISNPEEVTAQGVVGAQVDQVFNDRQTLIIESFEIIANFSSVGAVRLVLNPNMSSTATVYKLNSNNQPFGTHTMTLNLIVETQDQNLTIDNVMLASESATLVLTQNLFPLSFLFEGQSKELQILSLEVIVPAFLITSNEDPL